MPVFWFYVKLGFHHAFHWQVYEHILFLVVLFVAYTFDNWRKILLLVALFTVGHAVSLFLAVYKVISVDTKDIELLMPIVIITTALLNVFSVKKVWKNNKSDFLYISAAFFGLVYGVRVADYFITIRSHHHSTMIPLFEFALGIEIAQLILVIFVLIISFIFQTIFKFSDRDWVLVISCVVIGLVIPIFNNCQ